MLKTTLTDIKTPSGSSDSSLLSRSLSLKVKNSLKGLRRAKSQISILNNWRKTTEKSCLSPSTSSSTLVEQSLRLKPSYSHIITQKSIVNQDSFEKIQLIGRGDVGKVYLVREKVSDNYYAMKVLDKREMIKRNKIKRVLAEQEILVSDDSRSIL